MPARDFPLMFPGDVSDWISLGDYQRKLAAREIDERRSAAAKEPDEAKRERLLEAIEVRRKAMLEVADYIDPLAVKVRVVLHAKRLALTEKACVVDTKAADALSQFAVIDREWVQVGLHEIRGLSNDGGHKADSEPMREALANAGLIPLIADIVAEWNRIKVGDRSAFFTSAPAGAPTAAPSATTARRPLSAAGSIPGSA